MEGESMDFKTYLIEQLIKDISMGPFGSDIKKEVYQSSGIPVLNGSNLIGFKLKEDSFGYVSEEKANQLKKFNAHRGDIVVTHRGTLGQIVYIPYDSLFDRYLISQSQFRFTCDETLVIPEYFVYYFHTKIGQYKLLSNASQVGVPALARATSTFRKIEIDIPPVSYQIEVMKILSSLDAKIETNNELNEKLEEMAQAIFKSWFVDFEPFKDKPFHETELGMIPEGWEVGVLSDISTITMGQSPCGTSYNENGEGIIFYQGRTEFGFRFPSIRLYTTAPSRFAEVGSTLMSVRAPVGDINMALVKCCIGRGVASIKSNCDCDSYIYYLMKSLKKRFDIYNGEGTVFGSVGRDTLRGMLITIPPSSVISDFEMNISKIDSRIKTNELESQRLASLRDTLLPRLMSGELIV